ncbi:ChaN family lipoprotein [Halarcobacter sp.]|uniref:ChaN family lipoprotein n=1 Tax=Halarcobacter sp. TaxID=2321133 RepID=UPI002AAB2534|nr:ChaN family lipoprotein [Halarcobacter sp.]
MLRFSLILIFTAFFFIGCSNKNPTTPLTHKIEKKEMIYSIKQAKEIDMQGLVKELEHYQIIFVGDHHNNEKTHKFFENLLKKLDKENYNLYLANEWFTPEHDSLLNDFTSGKLDGIRLKERRHWDEFTKYKWEYVEPLYETIKNNDGKLFGMNIPKDDRKKISLKEFDKMSKEEKKFYDSLDLNVSAHKQLVMPFLKHCNKMPQKTKEPCEQRMYRVQVAWDTYMAQNVAKIAKKVLKSSKDKLFVFVGAMHVEQNLGIPLRFSRLSNLPFITISNEKIEKEDLKIDTNKADVVYIYR